jgi:uncharacterized membrane protein HdeD (DUF308 family)
MTATTMQKQAASIPWWVVLLRASRYHFGVLLLINRSTTVLIIQFLGIYWFIDGIMSIVRIFIDKTAWGWKLFSGIIGILAGMAIIQYPLWATILIPTTMVWLFGFFGIIIGVLGLIQAFQGAGWGAGILGVLSILFGIVLLANPMLGAATLPFIFGFLGIVGGIAALVMAFRMK